MGLEKSSAQSEDINTKKPNKSKLDIWKVLGVDFFEDYILPTNPSSKNELFMMIYWNYRNKFLKMWLKGRIVFWYIYWVIHLWWLICHIHKDILWIDDILINVYPILVQVRTISRINEIMKFKNLKTKSPQKIDIND